MKIEKQDTANKIEILTHWFGKNLPGEYSDYILVIKSPHISMQKFFVDANGLIIVERKYKFREDFTPVYNRTDNASGNYFPMTSLAYIEDECNE